jgi:hypothetical protein
MKDSVARRFDMFIRARQYGETHAEAFPAGSRGNEVFAELNSVITELEGHATTQESGARAAKEGTAMKAVARAALREEMEAIARTAQVMAMTMLGLDDKFRLPRNLGDQAWLAAARAFARDAEPIKEEFIRRGLPADFIADLNADISAFEAAINNRAQKTGARVAAAVAIDGAIERGVNAVRELDAIVKNVFRNNPAALAGWASASHTERQARRASPETPPAETAPQTA